MISGIRTELAKLARPTALILASKYSSPVVWLQRVPTRSKLGFHIFDFATKKHRARCSRVGVMEYEVMITLVDTPSSMIASCIVLPS